MNRFDELFAKENCDDCRVRLRSEKDMTVEKTGIIAFGKLLCYECYEKNQQDFIDAYEWEDGKTDYEDSPVCPYCGNREGDAWELCENEGTTECGRCGKTYSYSRNIEVTYSTSKAEAQ